MGQHNRPREVGVGGPVGAALAAGARRSEIEETRRSLDCHPTVASVSIVC